MPTEPVTKFNPPSELFMDIVCIGGTPDATCDLCGTTHFATGGSTSLGETEIAEYREKAAQPKSKYWETNDDSVAIGFLDGKQVVYGCPCNKASRYENWIWNHRNMILEYLRRRLQQERNDADRLLKSL